jgi:hypothetical protein
MTLPIPWAWTTGKPSNISALALTSTLSVRSGVTLANQNGLARIKSADLPKFIRRCPSTLIRGQTHQLRRNCLTSRIWRGHTSRSSQDAARNQASRIARAWSWTPAGSLLRTIAKVSRSSC